MPVTIPETVFDKYFDVIDSTFTIFGVTCQLVYIDKIEEISTTNDNIPVNKSINQHRKDPSDYIRQNRVFKEVEKREDIVLKVYWEPKDWVKLTQGIVAPENAIQTIFYATDLDKIRRAKEIIVHKDIKDLQEMRFRRSGEAFPLGLRKIRYFGCFWERS
jgi:hypothetical protein